MPILDNRIQLTDAEAIAPGGQWVDEAGGTMSVSLDTDTFIEGVASIADRFSATRGGILWEETATRDWSSNVFYVWWRSDVAGKLSLKSEGGITMRFTGATVTDWFEVFIDGADTYGGGFKMAVVDIDEARALAVIGAAQSPNLVGNTGGTPPVTSAIQRIGIMFDVLGGAPGSADNNFVDAMWRLPAGEPGIVVSGNAGGSPEVPWAWQDIVDAGDIADPTKAWGTITQADGVIKINTPVQFGAQASPDQGNHKFEDVIKVIAWVSNLVADGFYGFTIVGDGVNTQSFIAGVESGGVGSQGWVVTAADDGPRWFIEATDSNIENAQFLGSTLIHSSVIDIAHNNDAMLNCVLVDGQRLIHSR